ANRPARCPIQVTYSYDVNQRMHCRFEDVQSGRVLEVDLSPGQDGKMAEGDVTEKVKEMEAVKVE
ncbi:MAG: hypothetical protein ACYSUD_18280, partial [Planctomycetota bacterium]